MIDENKKIANSYSQRLDEQSKILEGYDTLVLKQQNKSEGFVLFTFLITMVWFFSAIVLSIMAYVTQDPSLLKGSIYFVILGIVWTITTWVQSYLDIKRFQNLNSSLLKIFRDINLMITSIKSDNNRMEYGLDASSDLLCEAVKSRENSQLQRDIV